MIIKEKSKIVAEYNLLEPLAYEYDTNSSTILLQDGYEYDVFYEKTKDTINLIEVNS